MSQPAQPAAASARSVDARLEAAERAARVAAAFDAGRHNPFASVDLSPLSPEARAKVDAWQRARGFTPAT